LPCIVAGASVYRDRRLSRDERRARSGYAGTAEWISLGVEAERHMSIDDLALETSALATMTGTAHDWTPAFEA
jgi:hypothetical protein